MIRKITLNTNRITLLICFCLVTFASQKVIADFDLLDDLRPSTKAAKEEKRRPSIKLNGLSGYSQYDQNKRLQIYESIKKKVDTLHRSKYSKDLYFIKTKSFKGFPNLVLIDRNNDGIADEYQYKSSKANEKTQEFGYMFDLNRDGKADYILFNLGPLFSSKGGFHIEFVYYVNIDSNYDGRIDIVVFPDVDRDSDGMIDPNVYAWFYDTNYNGKVNKAEYLGKGLTEIIKVAGGKFRVSRILSKEIKYNSDLQFQNNILTDINNALGK
jgi:hypothetical protein